MKQSAGIIAFRRTPAIEVLLVHPGGPFYVKKDEGVWSIPKGEYTNEAPLEVAQREFTEETGNTIANSNFLCLNPVKLKSGKVVQAWAIETDFEKSFICSNTFELEWPPKSGKRLEFPEADKAEWFSLEKARIKIHPAQISFLDQLEVILKNSQRKD